MGFVATENDLNSLNFNFDLVDYARTNNFEILTPPTPPPMPPLLWHISLAFEDLSSDDFEVSPPIPPPMPTSLLWHISLPVEEDQNEQNEEYVDELETIESMSPEPLMNDDLEEKNEENLLTLNDLEEENVENLLAIESTSLEPPMNLNFDLVDYSNAVAVVEESPVVSECCTPEPIEIDEPCYFDLLPMEVRIKLNGVNLHKNRHLNS